MRRGLLLLLLVAGCGYQPPAQTNTSAPAYAADLEACHTQASKDVNTRNAKRGPRWLASGVTRWGDIEDATETCMQAKGYGGLRWCTADELSGGTRRGDVVVTASGLQCSDPPAANRRR